MCLSESNVQLSGVLLQPFTAALNMLCQPRLGCAVNSPGEETSARLYTEGKALRKDSQIEVDSPGAALASSNLQA